MSIPKAATLFTESGVVADGLVSLSMGAPGGEHLKSAARTITEASTQLMVSIRESGSYFNVWKLV